MSNITDCEFTLKDLPKKRKYLLDRLTEIYSKKNEKEINKILDSIKIKFREQEERGASNHKTRMIFIPLHDIQKYYLKSRDDITNFLEGPKSVLVHEVVHIFQNLAKDFPHTQYLIKNDDGRYEIDYDKYIADTGEKQSRFEQVLDMLNWGFTKPEIIHFLYNRKHDDRELWGSLIDKALEYKKNENQF